MQQVLLMEGLAPCSLFLVPFVIDKKLFRVLIQKDVVIILTVIPLLIRYSEIPQQVALSHSDHRC